MEVSIIAIGDELLIGQVVDTNSGNLAKLMAPFGWQVKQVEVVADDAEAIKAAIDRAMMSTDVVLTTGGLGPTKDDITKPLLCKYFGGELVRDPEVTKNIEEIFHKRGIKMNVLTADQALVPTSCRVIQNRVGTAPIMWFERDGKVLVSMPGVPFETLQMFERAVMPQLLEKFPNEEAIEHRTVIVADVTESALALQLDRWERALPDNFHLAYLPKPGIIRLRLDGHGADSASLKKEIDRLHVELSGIVKDNVIATHDATIGEALLEHARGARLTVATAESCTGGAIASQLTAIAGCSDVYAGGVVAYSNELKHAALGVDMAVIERYGAVSSEVAAQMAQGVAKLTGADVAVATTGIAGPTGATDERRLPDGLVIEAKPVGTVWFGVYAKGNLMTFCRRFPGTRDRVIDRAATTALTALIKAIKAN